jgi:hypothetical protein
VREGDRGQYFGQVLIAGTPLAYLLEPGRVGGGIGAAVSVERSEILEEGDEDADCSQCRSLY